MKFFLFKRKHKIWQKYYDKDKREVEVPKKSLFEFLEEQNIDRLDNYAINYFGRKITYRELFYEIDLCAKSMKAQGIRKGDVISICLPNIPESIIVFYAVSKIGAIANMIHPLSAETEIKYYVNISKSKYIIAIDILYKRIF